jgi:type I restriction enzyme S subunit
MRDGWTETALGSVLKLSNKKLGPHKEEPEIFAISKYDGVVLAQDYFDRRIASKSLDGYKVIGPGDWVYSTIHIDEGSIAVNHFPFRGVVSPMYTSMIWNSHLHDYRFFEFLLKSDGALIRYQENAQGTVHRRRSLSWKAFSEMTFVVPPLAEQKRIVDMVSSVDAYIDALQQQAFSARTARNAVLHELLSVDGDDWTETAISDVAEVLSGFAFKSELFKENEGIPLIRIRDLQKRDSTEAGYTGEYEERYVVNAGDFLIGMDGEFRCYEWLGPKALLNQRVCRIQSFNKSKIVPRFVYFLVNQYLEKIEESTSFTTVKHISAKQVKDIRFLMPPLAEQNRIVGIVSSMDDVIQSTEQAVIDAKAFRSGLLSELLSGKHEIPASYDSLLGAA